MKSEPTISISVSITGADNRLVFVDKGAIWLRLVDDKLVLPSPPNTALRQLNESNALVAVGALDEVSYFAAEPHSLTTVAGGDGEWVPLKRAFGLLDQREFMLAGRAVQLLRWRRENAFCGCCGGICTPHAKDPAMVCVSCGFHQYPRINPCIIVLVLRRDQALLASNANFQGNFYSCLAGFIEAGESAEQALHREVKEEVNIDVTNLRYIGSQAWPFPHSLMLGYLADWQAGDISPDGAEIIAADWFTRDNMPQIPARGSIARELIDYWWQEKT